MSNEHSFIDRCFTNGGRCNKSDTMKFDPDKVFVAIQYKNTKNVSYAIEDAVKKSGLKFVQENQILSNILISCKVCQDIQTSQFVIVDISNHNPNVFFELGLAYAFGKTVKLISDGSSDEPSDLKGIEYLKYDTNDVYLLSKELQTWFQSEKSGTYQRDSYLRGHLFLVEQMALTLDNYNADGDTTTLYNFSVKKIDLGDDESDCFALPYHDSVSVDVPEDFFDLRASLEDNSPLATKNVISQKRMKRFSIVLNNVKYEDRRTFAVSMNEKQLFDQEENYDWYDFNILYPTQELTIDITINKSWSLSEVRLTYADSLREVSTELRELRFNNNNIYVRMERPIVHLTYMIRWKWNLTKEMSH